MAKRGKGGSNILKPKQEKISKRIREPENLNQKSTNKFYPLFSFQNLDSKFCLHPCDIVHKAALIERLRILGALPWQTISDSPREQYGYEMIPFDEIKATRPSFLTNDVTEVMVFRFKGDESRVAGHKQNRIFYIVYIDPFLKLYDH